MTSLIDRILFCLVACLAVLFNVLGRVFGGKDWKEFDID